MTTGAKFRERIPRAGVAAGLTLGIAGLVGGAASAAVALAAHSGAPGRRPAPQNLDVLPFPDTPDAAPATNIDFPAVPPSQIRGVAVVGSRSGLHRGRLSAQPGDHGSAFTPRRPFAPGETVRVTATFRSRAAGTASGAPRARQLTFSFSVQRPLSPASGGGSGANGSGAAARPTAKRSQQPLTHSFVTEPGFKAPVVTMTGTDTDTRAGDIFLDAQKSGQNAAYILNPRGSLVWYHPTAAQGAGLSVRNVRVQRYHGRPVLTYWEGKTVSPPGAGRGVDMILNNHYQTIHTVRPGDGYRTQGADTHDFVLGHEGSEATAFIIIWSRVQANLTSIGGPPNGQAFDWIIQEVDIASGKVLWEWHALGHVPVADSYAHYDRKAPYDFFHLNSVQQLPSGNILISSRNTWAVYLINKKTGKIMWRLGGKHSNFKMGPGTQFQWQHDATLQDNGLMTLFDDAATPPEASQSRGLELHVSTATHKVTLIHAFKHVPPTLATAEGSVQLLRNRNVFVGWGKRPYFSEYTPNGKQLFGGSFRPPVASQRAYRFSDWIGAPLQRPALAVRRSAAGRDLLYAGWNGSTQVAKWRVLTSSKASGRFVKLGSPRKWSSFETSIEVLRASYFKVEALGVRGHVLATSAAVAGR